MAEKTSKSKRLLSWFKIALISIILLLTSSYNLLSRYHSALSENTLADQSFILKITSTLENSSPQRSIWNLSKEEKTIGLFMNNTWQTVYLLNASYPISEFHTDKDGNPIVSLSLPKSSILYGENLTIQIFYRIILKPHSLPEISIRNSGTLDDIQEELKRRYCQDVGPWQVNGSEIRKLALEIAGNETNVLLLLKNFILWIKQNVYYRTRGLPRYPAETLSERAGDCDDQANLLIAFCRVIGIPAYLQVGCIYLPGRDSGVTYWNGHWMLRLTRIGWHGWAMVYVPPWGWLPVDLTYSPASSYDPIEAIRNAALLRHPVAQYANITETDYIASSRSYREFLLSNGFKIYEHDVMFEEAKKYRELKGLILPHLYTFIQILR